MTTALATSLKHVKIAPKGMGLNDFVAQQEGFFAAEGLDVEFDWKTFRGTQSSWKDLDYFLRSQNRSNRIQCHVSGVRHACQPPHKPPMNKTG